MASGTKFVARLLVCGLMLSISHLAAADHHHHRGDGHVNHEGVSGAMSIDDAAAAAERRYPGSRVLRAGSGEGEPGMYEIRVLTPNGRIRTMVVDPNSGKISE